MSLNTEHLKNCIKTLESSLEHLNAAKSDSIEYEIFRNATIKSFELTLEAAGKLLRKALKLYSSNPQAIDELTYKNVLRTAAKHGLLTIDRVEYWFNYRDTRNTVAHDYGEALAEETLKLLPDFLNDVKVLQKTLQEKLSQNNA